MPSEQQINSNAVAGFWRRLGAFFLDGLVLGLVGWLAGLVLADQFVQLGPWGRLLGFCVALPYFGLLNSRWGGGQTLGKRVLGIKVVGADGSLLSASRASARFVPLGMVWFLNGAQWPQAVLTSAFAYVLAAVIFGVGLAVVYLFVFNRATRQSLHDWMVGSYVVRAGSHQEPVNVQPIWRVHVAVCVVLLIGSAIVPHFGMRAENSAFAPLFNIYKAVNTESWIRQAQVNKGQTYVANAGKSATQSTYLSIVAYLTDADIDNVDRARQLVKLAMSADPAVRHVDVIQVVLVHGYDIGIAASWRTHAHSHAPAEWVDGR